MLFSLPDEQVKGFVDQLVTCVPGNVASNELAVHAHLLAFDDELEQLVLGDLYLTGLEQILSVFSGIFHQVTPEQVVGRRCSAESSRIIIPTNSRNEMLGAPFLLV